MQEGGFRLQAADTRQAALRKAEQEHSRRGGDVIFTPNCLFVYRIANDIHRHVRKCDFLVRGYRSAFCKSSRRTRPCGPRLAAGGTVILRQAALL